MGLSADYIKRPAAEETINDPTNPKHYWRYRMHVTVEELRADRRLLADLQVRFQGSGEGSRVQEACDCMARPVCNSCPCR